MRRKSVKRLLLLEEVAGERTLVVGDELRCGAHHRLHVVEGGARGAGRLAGFQIDEALPAHVLARRVAGDVGEETPRRVGYAGVRQARGLDERPHRIGADAAHGDVSRRVVAVRDHRLEHVAGGGGAAQVIEHAATDRAHAVVDVELLCARQASRLDLLQVGRQHERLEAAATEQRYVGCVRRTPRLLRVADVDLGALLSGQRQKLVEEIGIGALRYGSGRSCGECLGAEHGSRARSETGEAQKLAAPNSARGQVTLRSKPWPNVRLSIGRAMMTGQLPGTQVAAADRLRLRWKQFGRDLPRIGCSGAQQKSGRPKAAAVDFLRSDLSGGGHRHHRHRGLVCTQSTSSSWRCAPCSSSG